ncbi:MAG: translation initiation factor IF-3 [Patescibacteria group bacterium]|nr:translation initiation factor IF-3 [Patescibacteria group bacterium]MCL5095411.1 translation initiation factor IF-3 [Patescibacteria group bacterium]
MDEKGKQIGVLTKDEALQKARDLELDLVEFAPNAQPPVAKIIDFKKFRYLENKRDQEIKKKTHEVEVKEIRLRPFIGNHDFEVRVKQAEGFIKEGNRLKVVVKFQGREFTKKEFGFNIIKKFTEALAKVAEPQGLVHFEGRALISHFAPVKQAYAKNEDEKSRQ